MSAHSLKPVPHTDVTFLINYRKKHWQTKKQLWGYKIFTSALKKDVTKNMLSTLFGKIFNTILTRIYQSGTWCSHEAATGAS